MHVEPDLLAKCKKNNRKAHNELYQKCFGFMMAISLRYCNNREDAESFVNQSFLKVVSNLEKYNEDVPFGSWISRITVNTIIDQFRRDKKHRENMSSIDMEDVKPSAAQVDFNKAAQELDAEELEQMIMTLPDMSKKVFNLFAIDGYTHKEIGEMLGMSDGTSKWHVSFARKSLQKLVKKSMENLKTMVLF
ncbi:RNA polymerase sigma factor [bacterium]|nr:RNA polymerase sigma factor [bacterium]MDC1222261.1 RNA polymerase sigma factor [Salibacteraceae bacterium]